MRNQQDSNSTPKKLPSAAITAWETYQAMGHSKQNHLDYLLYLEEKYKHRGGQPNNLETSHLASLLEKHDQQVALFKTTLQKLKQTDHNAHQLFIAYLAKPDNTAGSTL
jgi:hypothetical protein